MWPSLPLLRHRSLVIITTSLLTFLLLQTHSVGAPCIGEDASVILDCLEEAYDSRDLDGFIDLLAVDFAYYFRDNPNAFPRDSEIDAIAHLFADESVLSTNLEVLEGFTVSEGPEPKTWVISNLQLQLELELSKDGQFHKLVGKPENCVLHVRQVPEGGNCFEIYRWWWEEA